MSCHKSYNIYSTPPYLFSVVSAEHSITMCSSSLFLQLIFLYISIIVNIRENILDFILLYLLCLLIFFRKKYRVSRNVVIFFVLCIFRLPMYLGSKCWTFSWSPFNSDFKSVLILILSIKIDQISTLRRKKQ